MERQREAYELYEKNKNYMETAELLGVSQGTARRWVAIYRSENCNKSGDGGEKINEVLFGALELLKKRLTIADKYHTQLIHLLDTAKNDDEMSAKERQAIYSALSDLDVIKIGDLTNIITKLIDKNLGSEENTNENIEVVIKDAN